MDPIKVDLYPSVYHAILSHMPMIRVRKEQWKMNLQRHGMLNIGITDVIARNVFMFWGGGGL